MAGSPAALVLPAICWLLPLVPAQTREQAKAAVDGIVAAVNAKDAKLLEPLLSDRCTLPGLTPEQFSSQVAGVVAAWSWQVVEHRFKQRLRPRGRVLVTFVAANRGEWQFTMQLDETGKIVELQLFTPTPREEEFPIAFAGPDASVLSLVPFGEAWAVRAKADDKEGLWLIDSGAPRLVLDASAFSAPRYAGSGTFDITSATGATATADVCDVGTFEIGGQVATKVRAQRMDLAHLPNRHNYDGSVPFLGLLGARELAKFESRFDFDAATLTLVELNDAGEPVVPRPAALTARHEFELAHHLPLLRFTAGDTPLRLAFDTGAAGNLLHERFAADPALTLNNERTGTLSGTTVDSPSVSVADVSGLCIGGRAVPPMRTVFFAKMAVDGTDGIVGLQWVAGRAFALNYPQKCFVFGPHREGPTPR